MISLRPILYVHGILLLLLSLIMTIPMLLDLAMDNPEWKIFAESAFFTSFAGAILYLTNRGKKMAMSIRQAFIFTTTSYVMISAFSALPLYLSELDLSLVDAVFEATSGITSTGSTVLTGLDSMPPGILLWRSLLNAMGGVGIVVMAMAILPMLQIGGMQLFRTESSDTMDKMLPRTTQIAAMTTTIFAVLVACCAMAYWFAGMDGFEAINHAMATVSTGGFSTHDSSIAYYNNPAIEWVAIVFMLSGAIPLMLYYQMIRGRTYAIMRNSQVRWLVSIVLSAAIVLTLWQLVHFEGNSLYDTFRKSLFSVVAIVTTTGYAAADYMQWENFAICVFFLLTTIGGCTGSTSGGIKIFRFQILYQAAKVQLSRLLHPHGVFVPRYEGKPISDDISASVMGFIILFGVSFSVLAAFLAAFGLDFITAISAAAQALANVGPGLGDTIGPTGNYSTLPDGAKWLLAGAMIVGRLELFTAMVLVLPAFWRD